MQQEINIQVSPEEASNNDLINEIVCQKLSLSKEEINHIEILKRSIDARQKRIKINLRLRVFIQEDFVEQEITLPEYKNVEKSDEIIIVGAGPAGLFAAFK